MHRIKLKHVGKRGLPGLGVPAGGTTNQVLAKTSSADYATGWVNQSGGGGGSVDSVNAQTGTVVLGTDDILEGSTNRYYTDERSQDAVGGILTGTGTVSLAYNDSTPSITASVVPGGIDKNALGGSALSIANGGTGATSQNGAANAMLPTQTSNSGKFLTTNGVNASWGAAGDTVGPSISEDNALARFDSTSGKLLQNSGVLLDDSDNVTGVTSLSIDGLTDNTLVVGTSGLVYSATGNKLALGSTSPGGLTDFPSHRFEIYDNGGTNSDILQRVAGGSGVYDFGHSNGSLASPTASAFGNALGVVRASGYGTSGFRSAAQIVFGIDTSSNGASSVSSSSMPGSIVLSTSSQGSTSPTERVRITNKGYMGLNNNSVHSRLHVDGSVAFNAGASAAAKTSNYTLTETDFTVSADATSGPLTLSLPPITPSPSNIYGRLYFVERTDNTANTVTVAANGSDTIEGASSVTLNGQHKSYLLYAGLLSQWLIVAADLKVGSDVQAYDADLSSIASLAPSNDDIIQRKSGAWTNRSVSQFKSDLNVTKSDVGLGSVPNIDATLRANHTGTQTASTVSDFDSQVRTSRLDQMAAPTADISLNSHKLLAVTDPTDAQDAATKGYVDAIAQGLIVKASVQLATTANITLSGEQTIDGVLTSSSRILVKDQTTATENGIYVSAGGAWNRSTDADTGSELSAGAFTFVTDGTLNASSGWVQTTSGTITLGSTNLVFSQFSGAGQVIAGSGLTKTGNTIDVIAGTGISVAADNISVDSTVYRQGSTDVAIADGGTGSSSASGARTNLGLAIGTDVQGFDTTLSSLAAYNTNGILTQTAADTFTGRTLTAGSSKVSINNGSGVAGNPTIDLSEADISRNNLGGGALTVANGGTGSTTASLARTALGLAIGSDVQAFDTDLSALAGLADVGIVTRTGAGTLSARSIAVGSTKLTVTNADGVAGNPTIDAADATDSQKGVLLLTGDLGGTASAPTTPTSVHLTGAETITGIKTFSSAPVVPSASFPESAVTNLVSDLALKAPLASPSLTGVPTAPTAATGTNTTQVATTAFVMGEVVSGGSSVDHVYYVTTVGSDSSDGQSWGSAFATIEHAFTTAQATSLNDPATIYLGDGTFTINATVTITRLQSLIGLGAARTIIENAVNGPAFIYTGVSPEVTPYSTTNYPNTGLKGFTIRPSGTPGTDTAGIKVQDVVFPQITNVFANGFTGVRGVGIWVFNKELPNGASPGGFVERLQLKQVATDNNTYGILLDRLVAGQPNGINDYRTDQVGYVGYGNTSTNADNSVMYHTWQGVSVNARAVASGGNAQTGVMVQKGVQFYHGAISVQFNITGVNGANTVAPTAIKIQNSSTINCGDVVIRGESSGTGATSINIDDTSTFDCVGLLDFLYSTNFSAQIIGTGHNGNFKFSGGANGYGLTHNTTAATKPIHSIIEKVTLAGAANTAPPNGPAIRTTSGLLDATHPAFDWLRVTNQRYGLNSFDGTTTLTYLQVLQDVTKPILQVPQGIRIMSGANVYSGTGAPNVTGSVAGDYYLRTDTPTNFVQNLYVATAANTWSAMGVYNPSTGLRDVNNNLIVGLSPTASAVNYIGLQNNVTGQKPAFSALGTDTNVGMTFKTQGTGTTIFRPGTDTTIAAQFLKADNTTVVMNIDTTNSRVGIGTAIPSRTLDVVGVARLQTIVGASSSVPTPTAGAGAGTTPGTPIVTGSDVAGTIALTTGTSCPGTATVVTVSFGTSYPNAPYVILTPANSAAAVRNSAGAVFVDSVSTTTSGFVVKVGSTPLTDSTAYVWHYHVIG